MNIITLTLLLLLAMHHLLIAQILIPEFENPAKHRLFVNIGLEPELVTTIGYFSAITNSNEGANVYLGGSIKFAPLIISDRAWRLNFISAVDWKLSGRWKTIVTNDLYLAHNQNRAGAMHGLGFELRAAPLHYGKWWTKGFDLGWQYTAFTHITHSAAARDTFEDRYPGDTQPVGGPRDGWYGAAASRFRLGFLGKKELSDALAVQVGLGSLVAIQKQGILLGFSHAQVPFYFNTQITYSP